MTSKMPSMKKEKDSGKPSFWGNLAINFPSLKGAPSTKYYFECEQLLFREFFPSLKDRVLLKTDLWNEAKNTEILGWASDQGAYPVGFDIAADLVRQASSVFGNHRFRFLASDVRHLPFASNSFDLVYSMGTIEHFPEYRLATSELFRVLGPGGTAIIGVPNKLDPFLRPALVFCMSLFGLYPYGMEKSFTSKELRRLLESVGFQVTDRTGILFMPGWLRMLDLWLHYRLPALTPITAGLVSFFAYLYRHFPTLRRHGYLIACVAVKPGTKEST
jgi:ubiquinone/menaquinone biosynthesis C-methylase UbiE